MNRRLMMRSLAGTLASTALFAALRPSPGHAAATARRIDWIDLVPENERKAYRPGAPPPNHGGYLDDRRGAFGGFVQEKGADCTGIAQRFDPDCEPPGQQSMSGAVNPRLDGQLVQLSGYLVPLQTNAQGELTEFFFAPYVGACIHVPPPAPNQLIYVRSPRGQKMGSMYEPYTITGTLHARIKSVGLNASSYSLDLGSMRAMK